MDTPLSPLLSAPTLVAASASAAVAGGSKPAVRTVGHPPDATPFSHMLQAATALARLGAESTEVLDPLVVGTPDDPSAEELALVQPLPLPPLPPPQPAPVPEPSSTSLMQWVMQLSPPPESAVPSSSSSPSSSPAAATETPAGTASLRSDALARNPITAAADSLRRPVISEPPAGTLPFTLPGEVARATPGGQASEAAAAGTTDLPLLSTGGAAAAVVAAAGVAPPTGVVMAQGSPVAAPAQTWIQTPVTQPGFSGEVVVELVRRVGQAEQGMQSVTLHLNPEALGPVSVSIELTGSAARIEFGASEALTRHHLEAALPGLTEALRQEGVSLTHGSVHEASKESLAASATGDQASGGAGSEPRPRGEGLFEGHSGYGERAPRRETAVFSIDGRAASGPRGPTSPGLVPGRAGRLDLFA